ncbi:MAG TPA: VOC family protein [Jiangellaceae bacterium]|nr:VOC family protein [Jiangellaceae bacterium]
MSGRVVHFEVPFDDGDRARTFYREAFGWNIQELPEMDYTMVASGPTTDQGMPSEPGFINGGMFHRDVSPVRGPVITVDVDSIDAALEKIEKLGGSTVLAKQSVGDMGFSAYFNDPEGNLMGLWENAPQA